MNVEIKWENIDGEKAFNDQLIELVKNYAKNPNFKDFKFNISLEPNSRHIINLCIHTTNKDEEIDVQSNSYNLQNSLYLLKKNLEKKIKDYDPNATEKALLRQEKLQEQIRINREKALLAEKKKLEEKELKLKNKLSNEERERQKQLEKQNKEILKKLEKNRKEEEKADEKIIKELEEEKRELLEAQRIDQENKEKLERHVETLKFDVVAAELEEDKEIQEKIKEDKEKLKSLQAEENECLVIVEEIKDLYKQEFDLDRYIVNEPFQLGEYWFYFDGSYLYIATSEGQWAPLDYEEVLNYYELSKYNKFQELELRLIDARKRRKLHLKDLVDGQELLKELEQSKFRHKQLEKQQKENFKKLKEDYEKASSQTKEEMKTHIKPVQIEIAEVHEANEPFLTSFNMYAYHDGEGRYYLADEYGNWTESSKDIIYGQSKLADSDAKHEKKAGDQFTNARGDMFYFDGNIYYKLERGDWVPCTIAEALDLDQRKKEEESLKTKFFNFSNKKKEDDTVNVNNQQTTSQDAQVVDNTSTQLYEQTYDQYTANDQYATGYGQEQSSAQQWTDENGTTWYLDEFGNYYWWDGNEWVPYTY